VVFIANKYTYKEVKDYIESNNDYMLISTSYNNYKEKLKIKHRDHIFEMNFDSFKNSKQRCPLCNSTKKYTIEEVKKIINEKDKDYICVSDDYINNKTKIKIKHLLCNKIYESSLNNFLNKDNRCPYCNRQSKSENKIEKFLIENNINYEKEKRFKDCKDKRTLPFDFYLEDYNLCIEYDGEQHYDTLKYFKDKDYNKMKLELTQKHDRMKDEYCNNNNIKLLRISYKEKDDIERIIDEALFEIEHSTIV
jgi:very-short-patch-repair endonuclease